MRIAIVGATGTTGRSVVARALAQGHYVTAVARRPEKLEAANNLILVQGDVSLPGGLAGAFKNVDAVISCIGPEKNFSPGTLMSVGVGNILTECDTENVRRFVMQSGIGLSDGHEMSFGNRMVLHLWRRVFATAIADKAAAERITQRSHMEWVVVRPVGLLSRPAKGRYTAGPFARVAPLVALTYDDCADCLIQAATGQPTWLGKIVNVGV